MEFTNRLAVFDPCTHFEHKEGYLQTLLLNYLRKTPSKKYKFDFFFCFNRGPIKNYEDLLLFDGHPNINKIYLIDENIDKKEDIYIRQHTLDFSTGKVEFVEQPMPEDLPPLGGASGPNLGFYRAIQILLSNYDHENFFMVEHDSRPIKDYWFDSMHEYSINNDFLIAGSKYKGHQKWHYVLNYKDHLNGIGIYKNSPELLNFINEVEEYNKKVINESNWCINFDILNDRFYKTNKGKSLIKHPTPFIDTNFITNVSDPNDFYLTEQEIKSSHPDTIIVHQKEYRKLEDWRKNYQVDINFPKKDPNLDSCIFLLRQPRSAGNWLINCITNSLISRPNKIYDSHRIPYRLRISFDENIACDMFLLSNRLIDGLKKGFQTKIVNKFNFEQFTKLFSDNQKHLRPFLISTTSTSKFYKNSNVRTILHKFLTNHQSWGFNFNLDLYCILRDPFDKTKSLFTEKTQDEESTKQSFINFINSAALPDSFCIRAVSNVKNNGEIEFFHYEEALRIFNHFYMFDISSVKEFLTTCFLNTLKIHYNYSDFKKNNRFMLKSSHLVTLKEEELSNFLYERNPNINLLEYFNGRTFFDKLLYETYIPQTKSLKTYYSNKSVKNNIFDFSLAERELTVYSFIDKMQSASKINFKDFHSSWSSQGFNIVLMENKFIEHSALFSDKLHEFLHSMPRTVQAIPYEELFSFKHLIGLAELNSHEQFYYCDPNITNQGFESWEPDSIMHFMDYPKTHFLSCNSHQAEELLNFIFQSKERLLFTIKDPEHFPFTLENILSQLKPYMESLGWVRFSNSEALSKLFLNKKLSLQTYN